MNQELYNKLRGIAGADRVRAGEPMSLHTTFRIGGPADYFVMPADTRQLLDIVRLCREEEVPATVVGNGSNLLVGDRGFRGVIIQIGRGMGGIQTEGTRIRAQAGALMSAAAKEAADHGLAGLEFASGIPGTLGGGLVMNAGAYGGELKDCVREVTVLTPDDEIVTLSGEEMEFGYRTSRVQKEGGIITEAVLELKEGRQEEILGLMEQLRQRRQEKQPLDLPSAGSTFKRPEGFFAGKLIMDSGLRGLRVGNAQVSEKHCGFVVNRGGATAAEVRALMEQVQDEVEKRFGVRLEPEVRFIGEF